MDSYIKVEVALIISNLPDASGRMGRQVKGSDAEEGYAPEHIILGI